VTVPTWPEHEIRGNFYFGAAICRRGHAATTTIDPRGGLRLPLAAERCAHCGARVLTACPHCGLRLRGSFPGVITARFRPRDFCDGCGAALPWASRAARIMELENLLDEGGVDDADLAVITEQLARLREDAGMSAKEEKALWTTIKGRAGAVFMNEKVQALLWGIASAEARQHLGLPPQ